jgi:PA14 domain
VGFRMSPKAKRLLGAFTLAVLGVFSGGCEDDSSPAGLVSDPGQGHLDPGDRCATPNTGCACSKPAVVVECGKVQREAEGQTWCSVGHRTCAEDGLWGECEVEGLRVLPKAGPSSSAQALGAPAPCTSNVCDPFCQEVLDTGTALDLPEGLQATPEGGITLVPKDSTINDTTCTGIEVSPTPQVLTVTSLSGAGKDTGLLGEYYNRLFGEGEVPADATPDLTRVDQQVSFSWLGVPAPGFNADDYTVRWTGWIRPSVTRSYQLCTASDDGVRVWLGESPEPVIANWTEHASYEDCAQPTTLTANTLYKVRMEYYERSGDAVAELRWKHDGAVAGELIPSWNLQPPSTVILDGGFVVSPEFAQFTVAALPSGCFEGALRAAWSLDRLDRAVVDNLGKVSLFAPLAGDITATAYVGSFQAKGVVRVKVDVLDTQQAPAGSAGLLSGPASGTDPMTVLYPYEDTVFPLGLRAPTIQWDDGGAAASAVAITLTSPATGTSAFRWRKLIPAPTAGRYTVPQQVWSLFEGSAKGKTAAYSVQRVTAGVARPPVVRRFSFANAPVRGKIYYTQYARDGSTNMMVADPGSTKSATAVFPSDTGGSFGRKCPVCHSVSANGAMFATADKSFSSNGGLSQINADGSFSLLSDYSSSDTPYRDGADDWRGFAWAPLTPDGTYALAANNIWGNTNQEVVGIDAATRVVSVPGTFLSGGNGTGLLAKYYLNTVQTGWDWRRTDPKIDFNWGDTAPGGPVPTAFSVEWTGQVQAYTTEPYTFELQASGGVRLALGGSVVIDQLANAVNRTFTVTVALTRGEKTAIALSFRDTGANAAVALRWSTPTISKRLVPQTQLYPNDGWHGVLATYYDRNDYTAPFLTERLESNLDANWGSGGPRPMPNAHNDDWSVVFTGQLQAPATGDLQVCARAGGDVTISVDGVARRTATGVSDGCSSPFAVTEGTKYALEVRLKDLGGDAYLTLSWAMDGVFDAETVPSERLSPPAAWTPPNRGLTVTYYDTDNFNATQGAGVKVFATTRIEANADLSWGNYRPEFSSALTSSNSFTSRFTGRLEAPCSGLYELEVFADDGARLWLDDQRVVQQWSYGTQQGAVWLDAGLHDLKLDHRADGGGANVSLRWRAACMSVNAFTPIPNANLRPTGDRGTGGYVLSGGDNGNGQRYFVWATPSAPGDPSVDVSAESAGRWGLGESVMMVPSFAPDSSKLVFIDGDSAAGNGWRKGLSTFDFDQAGKVFKNRKTIVSTWPRGDVMKWPVFESDSRSVIYQATVPGDVCCRKADWTKYGYMGPTNYFEDPGKLFSVDTQAVDPAPVELRRLNQGERAWDRNKAYQPTMLPQAAGGYRWAVFTSTRPYGNLLNLQGQQDFSDTSAYTYISDYAKLQSMLWVAAVDDTPSAGVDRSHPAFFLPNQNFTEGPAAGFLNERAFWVTEACRPTGNTSASSCEVDEDCCGGATGAAACRIDSPVTVPPTRHCFKLPDVGSCVTRGSACVSSDECCMGTVCDDGVCAKPPGFAKFGPANFERVYESSCELGQLPDWTFFDLKATVPETGGKIEVYAESSDSPDDFQTLPVYPARVELDGVAEIETEEPPGTHPDFHRMPLDKALTEAGVVERKYLKITLRLVPNQSGIAAPVVFEFRQSFSCPPGE